MHIDDAADRRGRKVLLFAFLALAAIAYLVSLFNVKSVVDFGEATFASQATGAGAPLDAYLDVLAIDPVRETMEVRLDVATEPGPRGTHYGGTFERDVDLHVSDGDTEQEFLLRRNGRPSSRVFMVDLTGRIGHYPFDRYAANVVLNAQQLANGTRTAIPVRATVWEGVPSFVVRAANARPGDGSPELALRFNVRRPAPLVFFACVIYALMVLIAVSGSTIAALVFVGARRVEVGQVSALAAMVFALPVLRNVVPGSPPLGVLADVSILLWAELAVAIGLTLVVVTWVQLGTDR